MPSGTAPPAAGAQAQEGGMSPMIKSAVQGIAIFVGMQFLMKQITGNKGPATTTSTDASGLVMNVPANNGEIPPYHARPDKLDEGAVWSPIPQRIAPMWPTDSPLDITIVVSPTFVAEPIAKVPKERIVLDETGFALGDYNQQRSIDASFDVPAEVQNNGTLWGHFYIGISGSKLDPATPGYDPTRSFHFVHPLTQYIAQKKIRKTKNLLAAAEETDEPEEEIPTGPVIKSHYHPNFTMSFIPDSGVMNFPSLHPAVRQYVHLEASGARDGTGLNGWYYPLLFVNTFWQLKTHMTVLNSTVTRLPIHIDLQNFANWKFTLMASMDEGAKQTARNAAQGQAPPGGGDGSEFEMIKEVLLDTNIYLLATTVIVSIFHMIFEMMAFKSDISHYRNKKNNVGISVRSILGNVFMQGVIFLYLMDNNENTSWMILFTQGMGIVLEFWKITTVVNVRIRDAPNSIIPYRIAFEDKHVLSETEEKTKEYDAVAFNYMYMIAVPLLVAYGAYSLKYESHKSWYSFVIATLVGSVYAYGFLMMVPSLYINYRLKSVAHMPGRAMMYKFLNTFIDDLFAFTIKMPTLHRLATLRDDVIFFVYLYQSWKYKVDYTRVNEFGQGGDDEEVEEKIANQPLKSIPGADASVKKGLEGAKIAEDKANAVIGKTTGSSKKGGATKRK
ncbi:uncharacterized protein EAF01_008706 [Botrytis porri]|uniref:Cleft lip and palate transmembrane protein 1 n=1 Tax=Botrytis porri TaxID=87229 RepID=A0A4Z1KTQ9_9HELO|nr:uncharacterized protein EAF01_008706 [Botrytis porri]KAF7897740.1 hypothetical protein EAF01_008706 [Botrytis porri]TGO87897.1 hypothetical protein BPOR_0197g00170 [Botrytis porri]